MINVPPIALSGKNAASYVWNSYEGNFIAKMAKSAYAFFMGTKVCSSEARKYIASDATKNTYARSILERSVTLIDANSKNLLQTTARAVRTSSLRDNPNVSASTTPNPSTAPVQSMQPPVQSMQPPVQSMQPPMQSMQPPVQQSLVAATNDEPTSAEFITPGAAPEIFNAFGAVHSFFMILPMDGSMSARFALLRNNVKDFTQEINLGRMTKKDGLNSLLKLIDDHVNFLPITSDVQERILNFIKEMLKGEKNNTQDASEIIERYRFSIQQAAAQLLNYLSTEWKLDEVGKDYILQILEDVFTMLEPANRNAPDLEQRITEKAVQFVNFLPMENRLEVFQFLPVNVQRGIIRPMFEKDRVIFLRNCTGERQREILQCHSEDVRDRIMAKIENSSST